MRIFQITQSFYPVMGGIETYIDNLSTKLSLRGNDLYVITRFFPSKSKNTRKLKYKVIRLKEIKFLEKLKFKNFPHFYRSVYFYPLTKKLVSKLDPDVLHFHSRFYFTQARLLKKPTIFTSHTPYFWYWKKIFIRKYFLDSFDIILCLTKRLLNMVNKISSSRAVYLPHGIDTKRFSPNLDRNVIRLRHNISKDEKIILCLGRMVFYKGYHIMIKSMLYILEKNKKVKLIIVGSGPLLNELKSLAIKYNLQNNVIFAGRVEDEFIPLYYAGCDIFVHPALKAEYSPRVIFEALASGKPIISTYSGGVVEIIKNFQNGVLIKPNDPKKLSETILNLLSNSKLLQKLSSSALQSALNEYSWDIIINKYLEIVKSIL
ncbi:MAG: glycosyltransferase family 4 protein [Candidatus Helarchaeota archaeon]